MNLHGIIFCRRNKLQIKQNTRHLTSKRFRIVIKYATSNYHPPSLRLHSCKSEQWYCLIISMKWQTHDIHYHYIFVDMFFCYRSLRDLGHSHKTRLNYGLIFSAFLLLFEASVAYVKVDILWEGKIGQKAIKINVNKRINNKYKTNKNCIYYFSEIMWWNEAGEKLTLMGSRFGVSLRFCVNKHSWLQNIRLATNMLKRIF